MSIRFHPDVENEWTDEKRNTAEAVSRDEFGRFPIFRNVVTIRPHTDKTPTLPQFSH